MMLAFELVVANFCIVVVLLYFFGPPLARNR